MSIVISAALVNELRKRTGAAMMDCKQALQASEGDIEKAVEVLRKQGQAKSDKKAGRTAAEGLVAIADNQKQAAMVEVNTETDFTSRNEHVKDFVKKVAETALVTKETDVSAFSKLTLQGGQTVEDERQGLVTKIGENIQIRRIVHSKENAVCVGTYTHGGRIGVIVELDSENSALAKDIAMHIAASKPLVIAPEDVADDIIAKEKEIYLAQAMASGKPQEIVEKMVSGRVKKYLEEISLLGQPFVKDPDTTVGSLLTKNRVKVLAFHRYEVGEGIEKRTEDFKEAVMSQVQGG